MLHNHQNSLSVYLSRFCSISFTRFSPFRLLSSTVYSSLETFSFRLFVCCLVSSCWQLAPHIIIMTLFKIFDLKKRERREKWKTASRANKIHTNLLGYAQQLTTTTKTLSMETKWNEEKIFPALFFELILYSQRWTEYHVEQDYSSFAGVCVSACIWSIRILRRKPRCEMMDAHNVQGTKDSHLEK